MTAIMGLMIVIPVIYSKRIASVAQSLISSNINADVNFSNPELSFFRRFPVLTLTLKDFSISGVPGFESDTLIKGSELSFGVDLFSIFGNNVVIDKIYGRDVNLNIIMGRNGKANFDIFPEGDTEIESEDGALNDESAEGSISIKKISFRNSRLTFADESMNLKVSASGFNFNGTLRGDELRYSVKSAIAAESFTAFYDGVNYVNNKSMSSDLLLQIENDMNLFRFDGSTIELEGLEADVNGVIDVPEKGYKVDLTLSSGKTKLRDIFSVVPRDMLPIGKDNIFKGLASFEVKIKDSDTLSATTGNGVFVTMAVANGYIKTKEAPVPLSDINLSFKFAMPSFSMSRANLNVDNLSFTLDNNKSSANFSIKGFEKPDISSQFRGELNLGMLTQALGLEGFKFDGALTFNGVANGKYDSSAGTIPVTDIAITLQKGSLSTPYISESLSDINASVLIKSLNGSLEDLSLEITPLEFNFADGPFFMECKLQNFKNPSYIINSKGVLNLDKIWKLLGIGNAKVKGVLTADLSLRGEGLPAGGPDYGKADGNGSLGLRNFEYKSDDYKYPFKIPESSFKFEKERAILSNTRLEYGSNNILLDGYASDFINYYIGKGVVKGSLNVKSDEINLSDFIALIPAGDTLEQPTEGVIMIPERMNLYLKTNIKRINYESMVARNFNGEVAIGERTFFINGTGVNIAGARFMLDAVYKPLSERLADIEFHARADSFDIGRAYREIPMMRELFTTAKSMDGIISMDYKISAKLDASMMPLYPSVKGKGFVRLENVNIKGLKLLGAISKATGRDSIDNPNLRAVTIRTTIANNIMKIERTRMRIFGFRPRFEGETSLDGKLNINFRLGLPPLGIIGIPLTITGTFDNPVVEIRRGKEEDKLEEEEY